MSDKSPVERTASGRFAPGVSGNPKGRPPSKRNQITDLRQDLELAIRRNIDAKDVQEIVQAMIQQAKEGSIGAARLLLDKVLPNAKEADDPAGSGQTYVFRVENVTVAAVPAQPEQPEAIEAEYTEVTHEREAEPHSEHERREHRGEGSDEASPAPAPELHGAVGPAGQPEHESR